MNRILRICALILLAAVIWNMRKDPLQKKYPFARLTPDYGILSEVDLWMNEQGIRPMPLSEGSSAYPYWQCFPTSKIVFSCKDLDTDEHRIHMGSIMIRVDLSHSYEEYEGRHGMPMDACQAHIGEWKELTKGQEYTCISGNYVAQEAQNISGNPVQGRGWIYNMLKTRGGCSSWFEGDCAIRKKITTR